MPSYIVGVNGAESMERLGLYFVLALVWLALAVIGRGNHPATTTIYVTISGLFAAGAFLCFINACLDYETSGILKILAPIAAAALIIGAAVFAAMVIIARKYPDDEWENLEREDNGDYIFEEEEEEEDEEE